MAKKISLRKILILTFTTVTVVTTLSFLVFLLTCGDCEHTFVKFTFIPVIGIVVALAITGSLMSVLGWFQAVKNIFVMINNVNHLFTQAGWFYRTNRVNLILASKYLSEPGLVARTKIFSGLSWFLLGCIFWVPMILVGKYLP